MNRQRFRVDVARYICPKFLMDPLHLKALNTICAYTLLPEPSRVLILPPPPPCEKDAAEAARVEKLMDQDISCIIPNWLYLSGALGAMSKGAEETYKIRHVISVGFILAEPQKQHYSADTVFTPIRLDDEPDAPLETVLPTVVSILKQNSKTQIPTLVHCQMGISRSVSCIIAFLMNQTAATLTGLLQTYGISPEEIKQTILARQSNLWKTAYEIVRMKRPIATPNPGFKDVLRHHGQSWLFL